MDLQVFLCCAGVLHMWWYGFRKLPVDPIVAEATYSPIPMCEEKFLPLASYSVFVICFIDESFYNILIISVWNEPEQLFFEKHKSLLKLQMHSAATNGDCPTGLCSFCSEGQVWQQGYLSTRFNLVFRITGKFSLPCFFLSVLLTVLQFWMAWH